MLTYLVTVSAIFSLLVGMILVQRIYRHFAATHPELGPFRQEGCCGCGSLKKDCSSGSNCKSAEH
ncbi:hypothetical protein HCX48_08720 [Rhodocyclus tenuis]|uniref:FeoB-associated Cys-rich membrane protein n=2 Tax=Rhodocyclus TaxID=1064 RepID=A0A6L5JXT1_RHOTE|nr:hypothetical protein [Rhodocyclus gracilis]MQY51454.1 hypothetical protein [Rhodocyclus gracilis]MRD72196.1 hypothetical protein [Rhodocyclus gracilis]NJA89302.1 hypothetical protein [Rhodocyclus gracilis]